MSDDKIRTTIRIEDKTLNKIKYIAKSSKRSFNSQVEFFLDQCINDFEKEHGPIHPQEEK